MAVREKGSLEETLGFLGEVMALRSLSLTYQERLDPVDADAREEMRGEISSQIDVLKKKYGGLLGHPEQQYLAALDSAHLVFRSESERLGLTLEEAGMYGSSDANTPGIGSLSYRAKSALHRLGHPDTVTLRRVIAAHDGGFFKRLSQCGKVTVREIEARVLKPFGLSYDTPLP